MALQGKDTGPTLRWPKLAKTFITLGIVLGSLGARIFLASPRKLATENRGMMGMKPTALYGG